MHPGLQARYHSCADVFHAGTIFRDIGFAGIAGYLANRFVVLRNQHVSFIELRAINGVSTVTGDFTCCYIGYLIGTAGTVAGAERTLFVIPAQCIGTKVE